MKMIIAYVAYIVQPSYAAQKIFFFCKSSRMNLRGQKCLTTPEMSKPVREIKKKINVKEKNRTKINIRKNKAGYTANK